MKIIKEINEYILSQKICLIPTMGALHAGHESLIKEGKESGHSVMVSIFVNEMQFNDKNDFNNYPKTIEEDIKTLEKLDIDYLFIPESNYIYPDGEFEKLESGNIGKKFEGKSRPGHFDGVLTVVNRLFTLIQPEVAIFGKKDAQQLFLIKEMVYKKNYEIKIIESSTVRDTLGLALSSRNSLLTATGKKNARLLYQILNKAKRDFLETKKPIVSDKFSGTYSNTDINIDYLEILDLDTFSKPTDKTDVYIIIIAAYIENIRLIDNIEFRLEKE